MAGNRIIRIHKTFEDTVSTVSSVPDLGVRATSRPTAGAGAPWVPYEPALDALQGALGVLGAKWSLSVLARLTSGTHRSGTVRT